MSRSTKFSRNSVAALAWLWAIAVVAAPLAAQAPASTQAPKTSSPPARTEAKSTTGYRLLVSTDRPDAMYHRGDKVTFRVTLNQFDEPIDGAEAKYTLSVDGYKPALEEGTLTLSKGEATLTSQLDTPGFLQLRVEFTRPDGKTLVALGGAAVDPLEIKPSLPVPDDFDAYWAEQKKQLAAVPMNLKLTPVDSPAPGIECFDVQADIPGGVVTGYMARPKGAKPKSLPAIMISHGAGVLSARLEEYAIPWAKDGFMAIDFGVHGLPNGKPKEFYAEKAAGELRSYYLKDLSSRDSMFFRRMIFRDMRIVDVLTSQPQWDGQVLVAEGVSQGGGQTLIIAGLDPRITFFASQVPAICDHSGFAANRISGWPKLVPRNSAGEYDKQALEVARYFDAMNFATRIKAPGMVTVGFIDLTCPPTSIYAAYNNIPGQKAMLNMPKGIHERTELASSSVRHAILAHLQTVRQKNAKPAAEPAK